jgi:ribosomal protein L16 Arg81 hydroxylase
MSIYSKFETLISPHTVEEFFENYYEKKYLYISRNDKKYYDEILNSDDVDLFFQNKSLQASGLRVAKEGNNLPVHKWTRTLGQSSIVDNDKLFLLLHQGYTVIIQAADRSIIKLINFCSELELELQFILQFNIYITPPHSQGLEPHYDDHDIFILPVCGYKTWRFYNTAFELPSHKQPYYKHMSNFELATPYFEQEIKPGDLLYIPRGLVHEAVTTDSTSIHITLGLHPFYGFDLLQEIVELARDNLEFRRATPNGFTDKYQRSLFKEKFYQLCQDFVNNLDVDELLERKLNQFIKNKTSENQKRFKDFLQVHQLNLNSILSRRENIIFRVDKDNENIYINFSGKKLEFPLVMALSINTILQAEPFTVKDIGGLISDQEKIDLTTQFVREGFLKIDNVNF